jgi:hypothetical protein
MAEQEAEAPAGGVAGQGGHLDTIRGQRRSLRRALGDVELALASPPSSGHQAWVARIHDTMGKVSETFELHVEVTEGPGGMYEEVLEVAPRLANVVRRFKAEHAAIRLGINAELVRLAAAAAGEPVDIEATRVRLNRLLGRLVRHRQQGADLIYEAFAVDIGGES